MRIYPGGQCPESVGQASTIKAIPFLVFCELPVTVRLTQYNLFLVVFFFSERGIFPVLRAVFQLFLDYLYVCI
jgi:hypothetical protein